MARKELFDIPKKFYINEELSLWADLHCEEKNISFASYIRQLISDHKDHIEAELYKRNQEDDRARAPQVMPHPNGLYTLEQVAELINAVAGKRQ